MSAQVLLDGHSLTRAKLVAIAQGATVTLDAAQLEVVHRAAEFFSEQVRKQEPIYGVTTGFGSNADRLLGAHRVRDRGTGAVAETGLLEELQRNLVISRKPNRKSRSGGQTCRCCYARSRGPRWIVKMCPSLSTP